MNDLVGILTGSDTFNEIINYAIGVDSYNRIQFSTDVNKARKFSSIEEAQNTFSTDSITFRRLVDGQLTQP